MNGILQTRVNQSLRPAEWVGVTYRGKLAPFLAVSKSLAGEVRLRRTDLFMFGGNVPIVHIDQVGIVQRNRGGDEKIRLITEVLRLRERVGILLGFADPKNQIGFTFRSDQRVSMLRPVDQADVKKLSDLLLAEGFRLFKEYNSPARGWPRFSFTAVKRIFSYLNEVGFTVRLPKTEELAALYLEKPVGEQIVSEPDRYEWAFDERNHPDIYRITFRGRTPELTPDHKYNRAKFRFVFK